MRGVEGGASATSNGQSIGPSAEFPAMFFFFSNRLGCLGSLLLSAAVTVALLFVFGMLRF
jgi:hypothetical protein